MTTEEDELFARVSEGAGVPSTSDDAEADGSDTRYCRADDGS